VSSKEAIKRKNLKVRQRQRMDESEYLKLLTRRAHIRLRGACPSSGVETGSPDASDQYSLQLETITKM